MFLFFIPSLHKQNGNNNIIKIPVKNYKIKQISHHYLFNQNINDTNLYMSNCVNAKKNKINNLHFLITSPEAAKIYRFVIILLIYYIKKYIIQNDDTKNCISIKNKDKNNINLINKLVNIPIISIGISTNYIINNKLKKNDFYNIYKNMSLENKKIYDINNYEFNKINKSLKNFNIVFTPSISNADTLKRELFLYYFQKQIKLFDLKHSNNLVDNNLTDNNLIDNNLIDNNLIDNNLIGVVWVSSAISMSNFEDIKKWNIEKKQNSNIKNVNVMRINCYDTKSINYSKKKLKKIKIKKNSIVCLMSNSAVLSFYQNFGNNFNYAYFVLFFFFFFCTHLASQIT
ncbi:asparagine-rich protein [Plasmodium yoelii yoelii]|uniref:Uroporphyrinogen-III synthase n=1 Tax=Plasmodium yoelii yoelii TaxID=73239 RepID=Q7R9L4_PLAYO|nr:asparagine-rich protein [Plasmodium yoelii yoelii]